MDYQQISAETTIAKKATSQSENGCGDAKGAPK